MPRWVSRVLRPGRLALLFVLLAALALPAAAPAATGGKITGRVTDSAGNPLVLGAAYAYRASTGQLAASSWIALGGYSLSVSSDGDYKVYFVDTLSSYTVPEFFDDKRSLADATPIAVSGGATRSGINASLVTGGRISGRVRATSTQGISGATVAAYDAATGAFATSATTSWDGSYTLPAIAPGDYKVYFVGPAGKGYISEFYDDKPTLTAATPVGVAAGRTTALRDAVLASGGTIAGTVTGDGGTALKDAVVAAYTSTGTFVTSATTSAAGAYELPAVPAGDYRVLFVGPTGSTYVSEYYDDKPSLATADPVSVTAGRQTAGIDARLSTGSRITGRVTDGAGKGVERTTVFAYRADTGAPVRGAYTTADGTYSLELEVGTYKVIFAPPDASGLLAEYYDDKPTRDAADPITVSAGSATTGIDATLAGPGQIAGKVTAAGRIGVAGATVTAYSLDGQAAGSATTGAGGAYTIGSLRPGSYKVGFSGPANGPYLPEYYDNRATLAAGDPVSVAAGRTTPVSAVLARSAAFAGRVTDKATGAPIAGAQISAVTPAGAPVGAATADAKGLYTIGGLAPGTYKLRFAGPDGSTYTAEYFHDQSTLAAGKALTLGDGRVMGVSEALRRPPPPGRISGTVSGDSGARAPGVTVTAYTPSGTEAASATSAADGTYTIDGLDPGSYKVGFRGPADGRYLPEYYRNKATLKVANTVRVASGRTAWASGSLAELGAFTGRVTAKTGGAGIAGAVVTAFTPAGSVAGTATADAKGTYTLDRLAPGTYKLRFAGPDGSTYIPEYFHDQSTLAGAKLLKVYSSRTTAVSEALTAPPPPGGLRGFVRAAGGPRLGGVTVTAYTMAGDAAGSTTTAANGTYTLDGLPEGTYKVAFQSPPESRYIATFYRARSSIAAADPIKVRGGRPTTIRGTLTPAPRISGRVTDTGGRPVAGAVVTVYELSGDVVTSATAGGDGRWAIDTLTPGTYRVGFRGPPDSAYVPVFHRGKPTFERSNGVHLSRGEALTLDAALAAAV